MVHRLRQQETIAYYNSNADAFVNRTVNIDMSELYPRFTSLLPSGGKILDVGCGSGRDAQYFLSQGFEVVAIDASEEMVKYASNLMGQDALQMKFEDMAFRNEFDGVWASASLLHVERSLLGDILANLISSLRPKGHLYLSMREGQGDEFVDGRYFSYIAEPELKHLLEQQSDIELLEIWTTSDRQPNRDSYKWLNAVAMRRP
jgi:2-polyprenyl-3-methyl-5-hydroxy-6-metoxy-1,4-benzoquinol methylase